MSNIGDTSLKCAVELLEKQHPKKEFSLGKRQPPELQHMKPPAPIRQGSMSGSMSGKKDRDRDGGY